MKQTKLVLFLFLVLGLFSFRSDKGVKPGDYVISVAVAYGNMNCNGLTVKKVLGYDLTTRNPTQEYSGSSNLQRSVANYYDIPLDDVIVFTGYGKRYAAIISYYVDVSGWGCQVTNYSVGFGSTSEDALSDAIRIKKSIAPSANHSVVRYIYAP